VTDSHVTVLIATAMSMTGLDERAACGHLRLDQRHRGERDDE
jgi:hypothetical protein